MLVFVNLFTAALGDLVVVFPENPVGRVQDPFHEVVDVTPWSRPLGCLRPLAVELKVDRQRTRQRFTEVTRIECGLCLLAERGVTLAIVGAPL